MIPRPCRKCGASYTGERGSLCSSCREATRPHYRGAHQRRAARVRGRANADPRARCALCGQTSRPGDPWEAHHVDPTDPDSDLAPAHRSCNIAASDLGAAPGPLPVIPPPFPRKPRR